MRAYGELCGWTPARPPARTPGPGTGSRSPPIWVRETAFDAAVGEFAQAYADQTERDHAALVDAVLDGRVIARGDL
jgi:hypothetical protein